MSARGYTVTIKLKDDGALQRLEKLEREGLRLGGDFNRAAGLPTQQFGSLQKDLLGQSKTQSSLLGKIFGGSMGQLLKLTGIGAGIGILTTLMTKSSGILTGVLKIFEYGILIFIKPIADFIGLALRPIAMLFLKWMLTWYTKVMPIFTDFGEWLGKVLAAEIAPPTSTPPAGGGELPSPEFTDPFEAWKKLPGDILKWFEENTLKFPEAGAEGGLPSTDPIMEAWNTIVGVFDHIGKTAGTVLLDAWGNIRNWFDGLNDDIFNTIGPAWDQFTGWLSSVGADAYTWLQTSWTQFTDWMGLVGSDAATWLQDAWNGFTAWLGDIWASVTGGVVATAWKQIEGGFNTIVTFIQNIIDKIKSLLGGGRGEVPPAPGVQPPRTRGARQFGGSITEPIVGFGLNSGRGYSFGEAGPETIIPGSNMGNRSINVTMNLGGISDSTSLALERAKLRTEINAIADTL